MTVCTFCGDPGAFDIGRTPPKCPQSLKNSSCGLCNRMKHLEDRISDTRSLLEKLIKERRMLKTQMNQVHDPTSDLPPEILSHIFALCLPEGRPTPPNSRNPALPLPPPLLFGAVCKRWRQVAWTTSQLWQRVALYLNENTASWQTEMVEWWLARSGGLPLAIYLLHPPNNDLSENAHPFHSLIDLLNIHSRRWKHLDISIPRDLIIRFRANREGATQLTTLHIFNTSSRPFPSRERHGSFDMDNATLSLVSVQIYGLSFQAIGISWSNVTDVKLGSLFVDECLQVLKQASRLTHCQIFCVMRGGGELPIPNCAISHDHLQSLDITFARADISQMLTKWMLPSLETLWYAGDVNPLRSLLIRSSSPLTCLRLTYTSAAPDEDLIQLLHAAPSLEDLTVFDPVLGDGFYDLMGSTAFISNNDDSPKFLPRLRKLVLRCHPSDSWDYVPAMFGVETPPQNCRRRPLRDVEIDVMFEESEPEHIDEDNLRKMQRIINRGVRLTITDIRDDEESNLIEVAQRYYDTRDEDRDEDEDSDEVDGDISVDESDSGEK